MSNRTKLLLRIALTTQLEDDERYRPELTYQQVTQLEAIRSIPRVSDRPMEGNGLINQENCQLGETYQNVTQLETILPIPGVSDRPMDGNEFINLENYRPELTYQHVTQLEAIRSIPRVSDRPMEANGLINPENYRPELTNQSMTQSVATPPIAGPSDLMESDGLIYIENYRPELTNQIVTQLEAIPPIAGPSDCQMERDLREQACVIKTILVNYSDSADETSSDDIVMDQSFQVQSKTDSEDERIDKEKVRVPTRWRTKNPSTWKTNLIKVQRSKCLPYHNKKKQCAAKLPKYTNCANCRYNCSTNFNEYERKEICKFFWALGDNNRQKDFLLKHIDLLTPKRRKVDASSESARSISKVYYLQSVKGRFRVCLNFFKNTLCISHGPIETAIFGKDPSTGLFGGEDKRGRKEPGNKTSAEQLTLVKEHIESFPAMESHYVRKKKKYLDSKLSILKMYELYTELCKERNVRQVSEFTYRCTFCTSYNLSFFKPKKDQCPTCNKYSCAEDERKEDLQEEYALHKRRKDDCNEAMATDKLRSRNSDIFVTASFDLQSVLQIPSSGESQFYYTRKICVYNLTIYEGEGKNAYCYTWNEMNGKRGSNEIGSILLMYIKQLPTSVTEISLFSDTYGGQKRNQMVAAVLLHAVQHTHLEKIELKFLESGHSHMDADSMHAAIEYEKRYRSVFMMKDWLEIFKNARSKRSNLRQPKSKRGESKEPYKVVELKFSDFKDLKSLASTTIKNRNKDENGEMVSWLNIKCLKFEKASPQILFYRYDHHSAYKKIEVSRNSRNSKQNNLNNNDAELKQVYRKMLPISNAKKGDLMKLCRSGLIPQELHSWYESLPATDIIDRLPEPTSDEECDSD